MPLLMPRMLTQAQCLTTSRVRQRRYGLTLALAGLLLACALATPAQAQAQQDKNVEQRAARRLQLQVQALQQEVQAAQSAKAQSETERDALAKKLQGEARASARLRQQLAQTEAVRLALVTERNALTEKVAALDKPLLDQRSASEQALAAKSKELVDSQRASEAAGKQWQARFGQQLSLVGECTAKNDRLVVLGAELLQRYSDKGMREVVAQNERLLGLGDVEMFNLVQAYRDRTDAERFRPPPP